MARPLELITFVASILLTACGGSGVGGYTGGNTTPPGSSNNTGGSGNMGGSGNTGGSSGGGSAGGAASGCESMSASASLSTTVPTAYVLVTGTIDASATADACVLGYPLNGSDSAAPLVVITLPQPNHLYTSLATDTAGNVYVGSAGPAATSNGEVLVFAPAKGAAASPIRTLTVPATATSSGSPAAITVDPAGNIYVATGSLFTDAGSPIYEFPAGANGTVAPIRTLTVTSIGGFACQKLAIDSQGHLLCALQEVGKIAIFSDGALPARTISVADSGVGVNEIVDFDLDVGGNIYVAAAVELNLNLPVSIIEYAGGVTETSDTSPVSTISGDALPGNNYVSHISFDRDGNLYVYELGSSAALEPRVLRFAAGPRGFAAPTTELLAPYPNLSSFGMSGFSVD